MLRVYCELLPGVPVVPLLYPSLGDERRYGGGLLYLRGAFRNFTEPFVAVASDPREADFLLLPHNFPSVRRRRDYLKRYEELSRAQGKSVLVFWHGDSAAPAPLRRAIVFRTSQYRSAIRTNEIMMPAYAEDLLGCAALSLRRKSDCPTIGFCGWGSYKNTKNRLGSLVKDALLDLRMLCTGDASLAARKKGLRFRMAALRVLRESPLVRTNFLVRSSFSGHRDTARIDPAEGRREFIANMLESDFALSVKGDGNFSLRFYEALSLGRIPLLLDTECVLPLEDIVAYDRFVLRVVPRDLPRMAAIVRDFYDRMTPGEFMRMQREAREAFEHFLNIESFLRHAVTHILPPLR